MKVLVLGCGPAGLMAAHAAVVMGNDVAIVSKKRKSEMFGAQYLHRPIPKIDCGPSRLVEYRVVGSPEQYRQKVYGNEWQGAVSPEDLEQNHLGWNIRRAYDELWDLYGSYVIDESFEGPHQFAGFLQLPAAKESELIISSLPAPYLCMTPGDHQFKSQEIWAIGDAPERGVFNPVRGIPENTVVCNGEPDVGWYRTANVFGRSTTEWPAKRRPPVEGVARVTKPLETNCDCHPDIVRVGRYGKWQKGVLSHEAYYDIEGLLAKGIQEALF